MNVDYERLAQELNKFGKEILLLIKNKYSSVMTTEQQVYLDKLMSSPFFIKVDKPTKEDVLKFGKLDNNNPRIPNAPSAHGGRAKGDGMIHIYPYAQSFSNCNSYDEYFKLCKDNLVIHEIFHYFIRPDVVNINVTEIYDEFSHFLTEGLVQYYSETFALEHNLVIPNSDYNFNVRMAKAILNIFPKENNIDKIVFQKNFIEIINLAYNYSKVNFVNEYIQEKQKYKYLENIIVEASREANINETLMNKIVSSKMRTYKNINDHSRVIEDFQYQIRGLFKEETLISKYNEKIRQYDPVAFEHLQMKNKISETKISNNEQNNKLNTLNREQISENQDKIARLKGYKESLMKTKEDINNVRIKNINLSKEKPKTLVKQPNNISKGFVDAFVLALISGFVCGVTISISYVLYKAGVR